MEGFDWFKLPNYKKDKYIGKLNISEAFRTRQNNIHATIAMMQYYESERKRYKEQNIFLENLFLSLTKGQADFIKEQIDESCGGDNFELLLTKPSYKPEYTKEEDGYLMNVWVDQSVGYAGDDYYGDVIVEIEENKKYLKWSYSM